MSLDQHIEAEHETTSVLRILKINKVPVVNGPRSCFPWIRRYPVSGLVSQTWEVATIQSGVALAENNKHVIMDLTRQLQTTKKETSTGSVITVTTGGTPLMILRTTGIEPITQRTPR